MITSPVSSSSTEARSDAPGKLDDLARRVSAGDTRLEVLRNKRPDVLVGRATLDCGASLVLKLWNRRGALGALRRLSGTAAAQREWSALRRLHRHRVPVPEPLALVRLRGSAARHSHVLVMEDLGAGARASECLGDLVARGADSHRDHLENAVLTTTAEMIRVGVIDVDHTFTNFLVTSAGRPYRLDLELARCMRRATRHQELLGTMLGSLIGTYAFAVQPRTDLVDIFARKLSELVEPSGRIRQRARRRVDELLECQRRTRGLDVRVRLPW